MAKLEYLKDGYRMKAGDQFEVSNKDHIDYLKRNKIAKVVDEKSSPLPIEGKNPNDPHTQTPPIPEGDKVVVVEEKPSKPIVAKPA